ncbi:MAG: sulfite reductase flavoprotein subunit alpha, partial [Pseudomonadota bacterium]
MDKPFIPQDAPFSGDQRAWISGYLAGLKSRLGDAHKGDSKDTGTAPSIDILFGTQTGNAEQVAEEAAELATTNGLAPKVAALDDTSLDALQKMERLIVVVSTYGEGEMPDNAELFWDALSSGTAPRLESLQYGVLGLGDTSYEHFCQAAKLIDTRLEQLGAKRMAERIDCDVDYEDPASAWLQAAMPVAEIRDGAEQSPPIRKKKADSLWTRKNPYPARILENRLLSSSGSAKEIRHFSFDLADSGIRYEAGDALGVLPLNHRDLVDALLARLVSNYDDVVAGFDEPLGDLLTHRFEIMTPSQDLIGNIEKRARHQELTHVVGNGDREALDAFLWGRDTLDLLNLRPELVLDPVEFLSWLRPLQHRAYSISSSSKAHSSEIHLTVAAVRWQYEKREHRGVASTWLADCMSEGDEARIFLSPNKAFRVPADDDAPVIMVGPGTGIAPFRAFLEERRERAASGKNWLFFGDQHRAGDFIYEEEISAFMEQGVLTRLDLAFSRDQAEKIYVQHRMRENGAEIFRWLEQGGYFYVCGDATRMAKDVDEALHALVQSEGGYTPEAALE